MSADESGGRHRCTVDGAGYVYDPEKGDWKGGIPPGTRFEDLPAGWRCPACGGGKKMFEPITAATADLQTTRQEADTAEEQTDRS